MVGAPYVPGLLSLGCGGTEVALVAAFPLVPLPLPSAFLSGCGAAEKALTVDTGGVGRAQLVIPRASMCSGSSDSDEKEHAQDDESGDDDPKGKGVIESKGQGRGWGRGKRTNNSGADGGRAPTRARR